MTWPPDPSGDAEGRSAPLPSARSGEGAGPAADVPGRGLTGTPPAARAAGAAGAAGTAGGAATADEAGGAAVDRGAGADRSDAARAANAGADRAAGELPPDGGVRRARAERAVHGTLAAALILEAITVLLVPRAIAPLSDDGLAGGQLAFLLGLAGALLVASGLQRHKAGRVLGSVLQVPIIATGFLIGVMFALGVLFAVVWTFLLRLRRELLGTARPPAGP